jgi:hypothetical protein
LDKIKEKSVMGYRGEEKKGELEKYDFTYSLGKRNKIWLTDSFPPPLTFCK